MTPEERKEAVAVLRHAADRIESGAEVAVVKNEEYRWRAGFVGTRRAVVRRSEFMYPHEALRTAVDVASAANEAESTPTARREEP